MIATNTFFILPRPAGLSSTDWHLGCRIRIKRILRAGHTRVDGIAVVVAIPGLFLTTPFKAVTRNGRIQQHSRSSWPRIAFVYMELKKLRQCWIRFLESGILRWRPSDAVSENSSASR